MEKVVEIILAFLVGGVATVISKGIIDRKKNNAQAEKVKVEGDVTLIDVALKMTDRFQQSIISLEAKTENLIKSSGKLEQELVEIRIKNLTLSKEIELLKTKNIDLDQTCSILMRENMSLKLELENCIKKD